MPEAKTFITTDTVVFTIKDKSLCTVLIKRKNEPFKGKRALPGGFLEHNETAEQCAARELAEETHIKDIYLEQLGAFSDIGRDPRGHTMSIGFLGLIDYENLETLPDSDAEEVALLPYKAIGKLAFDHNKILLFAYQRLAQKLSHTDIAKYLLPDEFTLSQMQQVYETVLGEKIDVRNFRKWISGLNLIQETGTKLTGMRFRPAKLYRFKKQELQFIS
ncbi:MAG TPA: NUDIX domain-containing protein [Candidatus Absconditabacterales bacterium]|nr:NUDIX domain-containing protein [Candidatus Absconditabacterales bacterium]HMT27388.1 NUDIX domain-containing protein [Candidatus Absconditabacterales bacterium]